MKPVSNTTILYMDDDSDDVQMLHDAIKSIDASYKLIEAINGEEGLHKLSQLKQDYLLPCLIILDINMPKMDGRTTFQKIRADKDLSHIPIVVFSTSTNATDKLFFQGPKVEYITKPHTFRHLLQVTKQLLNHCSD